MIGLGDQLDGERGEIFIYGVNGICGGDKRD